MAPLNRAGIEGAPLTMELAVRFVVRESAGLAAAVRAPDDPVAVANALGWHNDGHPSWLALLAACQRAGWSSAEQVDQLYTYHGQLAELLERGVLTQHGTGSVLAQHLQRLTTDAIDGLRADAQAHAHGHAGAAATPVRGAGAGQPPPATHA